MKTLPVVIAVIVVTIAVFYFSKPTDNRCRDEALSIVAAETVQVPGYGDPSKTQTLTDQPQSDKILIKDKFLWKEVMYVYPQSVRKIGTAYLGSFHPGKSSKEP